MADNGNNLDLAISNLSELAQRVIFDQSGFTTLCVLVKESIHWRRAIVRRDSASCLSCTWTFAEDARFTIDFVPDREDYLGSTHVSSDDLQIEGNAMIAFATLILETFEIEHCNVVIPARTNIHSNFLFQTMLQLHPGVQFDTVEIVAANNDAESWNFEDLNMLLQQLVCDTLITHGMRADIGYPETVSINNVTINDRLWLNDIGLCNLNVRRININLPALNFEFTPVSVIAVIQAWYSGGLDRLEHFSCTFCYDPNRLNPFNSLMNGIPVLTDDVPVYPNPPLATAHRIIRRPGDQKCAYIGFKSSLWDPQPVFWLLPWFPENRILPNENLNFADEDPEDPPVPDLAAEEQVTFNEDPVDPREEDPEVGSEEEDRSLRRNNFVEEGLISYPICSNIGNGDPIEAKLDDEDSSVLNNAAEGSSNSNSKKRKRQSDVEKDPTESSTSTKEPMNAHCSTEQRQQSDDDQSFPKHEPSPAKRQRV